MLSRTSKFGVILRVFDQRKYIIIAFVIFAIIFVAFYFGSNFISGQKQEGNSIVEQAGDTTDTRNDGKVIFQYKCAACHILNKDFTGPSLTGFTGRGPWINRKKVLEYLIDPEKFYIKNKSEYIESLYQYSEIKHPAFLITEPEVDALIRYLNLWGEPIP